MMRKRWNADQPDQRQTLDQALASYTLEGAYAEFKEDRKGMLRAGALADVIVLSGDIAATPPIGCRSSRSPPPSATDASPIRADAKAA